MPSPLTLGRVYNSLIGSDNVRYTMLPGGAAGTTLTTAAVAWSYGSWVQIVASIGAADGWLVGIGGYNPSNIGNEYDLNIGSGAAASEVSLAEVPFILPVLFLPFPIHILATTRLAGRARSASGLADTVVVKAILITGV